MKKPYFYVKAVGVLAFLLLTQTSFAQEVENQQQTAADVTNVTEESGGSARSVRAQSRAAANNGIGASQMETVYPTSPNSVFKTEKSYSVDMSTGKASVQVPIATVGPQEIQIPIALSYSTGGIKLRDVASWVGLGWNLSAGGQIRRVKNKFADNLDGSMDVYLNLDLWTYTDETQGKSGNFDDWIKTKDTQPDLFYFDIPGKNGMFVLDPYGNASTIPYQNVKINYDKTTDFFEIIDDRGNRYSFQDTEITHMSKEVSSTLDKLQGIYTTTWNLTSISNVKGESLNFEYKNLGPTTAYNSSSYAKSLTIDMENVVEESTTAKYDIRVSPLYLSKISWFGGSVEFVSSKGRQDIPEEAYKLDAIRFYSGAHGDKLMKTFHFRYSAFANKALKMDKIEISTPVATAPQFFRKFEYITDYNLPQILPDSTNYYALDHWGYYNGKTTNKYGIPSFFIKFASGDAGISRQYDDKNTSPSHAMANSLKKIWVSSSAYEEFEYEGNMDKTGRAGGLRLKSITTKSEELGSVSQKVRYEYLDDDGTSSGVLFDIPHYHYLASHIDVPSMQNYHMEYYIVKDSPVSPLFDLDGSHIRYGKVREIFDNGSSTTYYFTTKADQPDAGYTNVRDLRQPSRVITYEMMAEEYKNFAPANTRFWKRGLLKEKISRDASGVETYRETYEYNLNAPIMKTVKGLYPMVYKSRNTGPGWYDFPYLVSYDYISQPFYVTKTTVTGTSVPDAVTEYIYDDGDTNKNDLDHVLLKQAIVKLGTDRYKTTYKYPFDYGNIYGTETGNAIEFMRDHNISAAPIEIVKYKNDKIIGGELYQYGTWSYMSNGSITGVMFNLKEVKELLLKKPKSVSDFVESVYTTPTQGEFRFTYDNGYVTKTVYEYNRANKVSCIKERNKPSQSTLYDETNTLPIARITNAEARVINGTPCDEAFYTSFEDSDGITNPRAKSGSKVLSGGYYTDMSHLVPGTYCVSYWVSYNDGVDWELWEHEVEVMENDDRQFTIGGPDCIVDEYRIWKKGAQMSTKTYDSNANVTSETDENGKTIYYEYDPYGRIKRALDNNRDIIKEYEYFIKN